MNQKPAFRTVVLIAALIAAVAAVVFFTHRPVLSVGAVSFDDDQFLTGDNPLVQRPSLKSAWHIFTEVLNPSSVTGYYQPLSVISIMLDYAAGGGDKNLLPFHRTNLILHILNTALIIVLLYVIFGRPFPAAMAGLLFGVHPLTVEPIAWITERKTPLAMFFALWCLIFYVRYARTKGRGFYIACMVMYISAMMSKPTSLPLSAALLVMDYWPLQRINAKNIKAVLFEKVPFFALGGIFAVITMISNARSVNLSSAESHVRIGLLQIPLVMCYLVSFYLGKIIWPVNLSSVYPLPEPLALSNPKVLAGVIITVIVVMILLYSAKRGRVFLGGGIFFLVIISPTLGLVRFSPWVVASDKYVYMPAVGLLMILAWCFGWMWKTAEQKFIVIKTVLIALVLTLSAGEVYGVRQYLTYWRDTIGLYEYIITTAPDAPPAHNNLGVAFAEAGRGDEAIAQFRQTLRLDPNYADAHNNLGAALKAKGELDEAINHYLAALRLRPGFTDAFYNLANALQMQGKSDKAADYFRQILRTKPNFVAAHNNLGTILQSQGKFAEAAEQYKQVLLVRPYDADAHYNLAEVLKLQGNYDQAIMHYRQVLSVEPNNAAVHNRLGNLLRTRNKPEEAAFQFREALKYKPDFAEAHYNLGNILSQQGRLVEAENQFRLAVQYKPDFAKAHNNLGDILQMEGKIDEALICFRKALQLDPNYVSALNEAAMILAAQPDVKKRNVGEAIELAERAAKLTAYKDAVVLDTLATAYAAAGQLERAITTEEAALEAAYAAKNTELANHIRGQLERYKGKRP